MIIKALIVETTFPVIIINYGTNLPVFIVESRYT